MKWGVYILGSQFAMEQRHITGVMFSAVVHPSRNSDCNSDEKGYIDGSFICGCATGANQRSGGTDKGFAGD